MSWRLCSLYAALAVGLPALLAGCGSGEEQQASPTVAIATSQPGATVVPGTEPSPTPTLRPESLTAVAAKGNVDMVEYRDPQGRYVTRAPKGWLVQEVENSVTFTLPDDPVQATLGIYCQPGFTTTQLLEQDNRLLERLGLGYIDPSKARPRPVAGVTGDLIRWPGNIGTVPLGRLSLYFEGNGCAWRILLTTFPGITVEELQPVFDRVADAFTFTSP